MATATFVQLDEPSLSNTPSLSSEDTQHEAVQLAKLCRQSLNDLEESLAEYSLTVDLTPDEVLALPLDKARIPDILHGLPGRRSSRRSLAAAIAALLYPVETDSLSAVIRYEADRIRLRDWVTLQRTFDRLVATKRNGRTVPGMTGGVGPGVPSPAWADRMMSQGPWDPKKRPISLNGVPALPAPVQLAEEEDLAPLLEHFANGGTHVLQSGALPGLEDRTDIPRFGIEGIEFRKGGVYEHGVMDLCKMVVGPERIGRLMDSLRGNTFIRHFLLGNNIIGPAGARAIADFIREFPDRMETWYLGGNCMDAAALGVLVDAIVTSPIVTGVWLKRNPLGSDAAEHLYRLVTESQNLHTLDLDQTELSNSGATALFTMLANHHDPNGRVLPLRHIYLTGTGLSVDAVRALFSFLQAPHCGVTSIYMCCNPLGDDGVEVLAAALPKAKNLMRMSLQSVGMTTKGAKLLFKAVAQHGSMRMLDVGQAFITEDLGAAYNFIENEAAPDLVNMIRSSRQLEYFVLGHCVVSPARMIEISKVILENKALVFYDATSIVASPSREELTAAEEAVQKHLEANVRARYGDDMSYERFMDEEKRWLRSDRSVKHTDSLFRSRDVWKARRGLIPLLKRWDEGDETLRKVQHAGQAA